MEAQLIAQEGRDAPALPAAAEQSHSISAALQEADTNTRRYLEHVVLLAHPALEGRLPGEEGSALAEAVITRTFKQLGLSAPFADGTYRQPFDFRQGGRFGSRELAKIVQGYNVAAALPGTGDLAQEWVVLGAHHDHLGRGAFGSRGGSGEIHEGADDNASGTAAVLLAAELLAEHLSGDETARRSILFITFSGEESGLNGSRFFVENAPVPLEAITLMVNLDMVGRISERAVKITGAGSGAGLKELIELSAQNSSLDVALPTGLTSRSDHAEFYRRDIPVLFITEAVFPDEYHTPADESWLIQVEEGAAVAKLAAEIVDRAAHLPNRPSFAKIEGFESGEGGPSMSDIKIRFGIKPGNYGDTEPGIAVAGVSPDTSAETAGILKGDILLMWNERPIEGVREWMLMMAEHEPGDIVIVRIQRGEEELDLPVMLKPRN